MNYNKSPIMRWNKSPMRYNESPMRSNEFKWVKNEVTMSLNESVWVTLSHQWGTTKVIMGYLES